MAQKPKILAFAGSLREHSYSKRIVKTAIKGAEAAGAEVTYIDLRDYPMPIYNADDHEQNGFDANALKLQKLLNEHDGLLIASPEYNASLSAALKNTIDWTSRKSDEFKLGEVFKGKVGAIMTESPGAFGGLRCLGHLRDVLTSGGICVFGVTKLPAATSEFLPTRTPSNIIAPMPIKQPVSIWQPCKVTRCPSVTSSSIIVGCVFRET